ncbi:MAG TPA: response regulator [Planctomycetota bacterium]|nr:response regulator [Planctomycetota bacterium]
MSVLVATEDRTERTLIAEVLAARRALGKVLFAEDGVEAYLHARRHLPELAIVSAGLARIDGIVLVRTLVRSPAFRSRTLLILGDGCHVRVREALDARPSGILVRPFDAATLVKRLEEILGLAEKPVPEPVRAPVAPAS